MKCVSIKPVGFRSLLHAFKALLIGGILFGQLAVAATYYVSPGGSDSNPGTATQPYRTVAKGVSQAVAGDTILLGDGTYTNEGHISDGTGGYYGYASPVTINTAGNANAWITLKAQNKGKAILDCGTTTTALGCDKYIYLNAGAGYWWFQDLVFTRGAWGGLGTDVSASNIHVKGCVFENIGNWNDTTQIGEDGLGFNTGATNWWVEGNVFHDIGRIGGSSLDHGIYADGSNATIINNVFYNNTHGWDIQIANGASNWLIANNTFAFPNPTLNGQIMMWNTNTNITIRNNIFYNPLGSGVTRYTSTAVNCVLDHNLVYGASSVISDTTGFTVGTNLVGNNPNFVNASTTSPDFHTQAGGGGIDAGVTIAAVTVDFDGVTRPQGPSYDLGAYELPVSAPVIPVGPVISGVFTSSIVTSSAIVNWSTDVASTSSVQYGTSTTYTSTTAMNSSLVTLHSVTLSALQPSTLYHYRVASQNSSGTVTYSGDSTFTTAAPVVVSSFAMSPSTGSMTINQGSSGTVTINAALVSGAPGTVSFATGSLPSGVKASFSTPSCNPTCTTKLTLSASSTAATGTSAVGITGTSPNSSSSTVMNLAVNSVISKTGSPDTRTGIMALWDFGELKGTTTADLSGNGNTGTLVNAQWNSTVCGGCVWLNGVNSSVTVAESPTLEPAQMTVTMWVRAGSNGSGVDPRLISKRYSWDIKLNGTNRYPQFSAGGAYAELNYSLPVNLWQHVVFTFSGGTVTAYINGQPALFATNTFTSSSTIPLQMYGLALGTDSSNSTYYNGYMDDVRIYNRVLTPADVWSLYSTTIHK